MAESSSRRLARPPVQSRLNKKRVAEALRTSAGIQAVAAQKLMVSRPTLCRYLKRHPDLKAVIEETQDEVTDIAEGQLIAAMRKGEGWAIKYFLDNFGQKRGYGIRKLAFKDGDGQMIVPGVLISNGRMTEEEWLEHARRYQAGLSPTAEIPPSEIN